MGRKPVDRDSPEYQEAYRRAMAGDANPHIPVHVVGGPCVDDAPSWHKFTPMVHDVTCEACKVTIALLEDGERTPQFDISGRRPKVLDDLAGDADPVALAMYKVKHAQDCPDCEGTGKKVYRSFSLRKCKTCRGTGKRES